MCGRGLGTSTVNVHT
uniref:Uncharacterized protein n=1 Tax=Tetraselmis sp. GSL018 TaxID=582737 RepID=A0A061R3G5_9CHLO